MSQNTSGARAIFSLAWVYRLAQWGIGATNFRKVVSSEYVRPTADMRVFDIGSGTSDIVGDLGDVEYFGLEPSEAYATAARERLGERATIITGGIDDFDPTPWTASCDTVLSIGVLHHLSDDQAAALLRAASVLLKPGGTFVAVDPCLVDGQHAIARALITRDRGQHVRSAEQMRTLTSTFFPQATIATRHDLLRVPYTHSIVRANV